MLRKLALLGCWALTGCSLFPDVLHQPTIHNPFPQLSRVAVAPFFNLSNEPTLNAQQVAISYYNELQLVPGFEVVPVGVVETAMRTHHISLNGAAEARQLAQLLHVDAIVVGAITEFSPYYPPRCGLQVEWYSANPGFHPIPPGYGLPWGTHEEQDIPGPLVTEAEFALAKEQLKTQSPVAPKPEDGHAGPVGDALKQGVDGMSIWAKLHSADKDGSGKDATTGAGGAIAATDSEEPKFWPDPRGFVPPPPLRQPPTCWPSDAPVMRHTRIYDGHDGEFTTALESYYVSRDDARFDGWQGYLQRSDDFLRFCCRMHIWEMLTARGGAGETRVVWRWPTNR